MAGQAVRVTAFETARQDEISKLQDQATYFKIGSESDAPRMPEDLNYGFLSTRFDIS